MDLSGFCAGSVAGIFRFAQNLALVALAHDSFLFFLWLVEPVLSLFSLILDSARLFPRGSDGPLSTRVPKDRYHGAVDPAAIWGSGFKGSLYSICRCDNLFAGHGNSWPKNSAIRDGRTDFHRPSDGAGGVIQQQTDLVADQSCK